MSHLLFCVLAAFAISSAWESLAHKWILHAPPRHSIAWRRHGGLGVLLRRARFNHLMHHVSVHSPTWTEDRLTHTPLLSSGVIQQLRETDFGKTIHPTPDALLLFSGVPLLLILPLFQCFSPDWMLLGGLIGLFPFAMTRYVHPHLHAPPPAKQKPNGPVLVCLDLLRGYHRQHHDRPWINFNLLPGFDLLFHCRSRLRTAIKTIQTDRLNPNLLPSDGE